MLVALNLASVLTMLAPAPVVARPVIIPQPIPMPTTATPVAPVSSDNLSARLVPDLVIREIRVEGDKDIHVLIANDGTGPAEDIRVSADADIGSQHGITVLPSGISRLEVGESKWARVTGLTTGGYYYAGKDTSFPLSKATRVNARVDPSLPSWMSSGSGGVYGRKRACSDSYGCIKELREDNNSMTVEGDAIGRGAPN